MPLGSNTTLITTAAGFNVANNGTNDSYTDASVAAATGKATVGEAVAYVFSAGDTGDDRLENFNHNDSIVNYQQIFDGNNDGIINFGVTAFSTSIVPAARGPVPIRLLLERTWKSRTFVILVRKKAALSMPTTAPSRSLTPRPPRRSWKAPSATTRSMLRAATRCSCSTLHSA
jgi:hypothetical protein